MDHIGAIFEGEWNPLHGMCFEEANFMAQLLGDCSFVNEVPVGVNYSISPAVWSPSLYDGGSMHSFSTTDSSVPQGCSFLSNENSYPASSHQFIVSNSSLMNMDSQRMEAKTSISQSHILAANAMQGDEFLNQDDGDSSIESNEKALNVLQGKKLKAGKELPMLEEDKFNCPSELKKRSHIPAQQAQVERNRENKKLKTYDEDTEDSNGKLQRHSSSEDDSNCLQEIMQVSLSSSSLNSNGKTRASRGSATDPQSLYARKRRERINERLRILQNLVPNGTKVDISTMLEEAVQYVKFLQLQIKMLSSDELWMYAPIAYNGMEIGLDFKIPTPKPQC